MVEIHAAGRRDGSVVAEAAEAAEAEVVSVVAVAEAEVVSAARRAGEGRAAGVPRRRRSCHFCGNGIKVIDYKNVDLLWNYLDDREKIIGHRQSGTCQKHQRRLSVAIKRARTIALLPYTPEHTRTR